MSKAVKKKSRRMWRTVRKTLGTLFLVSALVIAAIPVDGLQAANGTSSGNPVDGRDDKYSWLPECSVPSIGVLATAPEIYVDENRRFEFVYAEFGSTWNAIITEYNGGYVENGVLTIPDTISAYKRYNPNDGSGGDVAVGRNGNFLFYRDSETRTYPNVLAAAAANPSSLVTSPNKFVRVVSSTENGATNPDTGAWVPNGTYTIVLEEETGIYRPCDSREADKWWELDSTRLYYDTGHVAGNGVPDNTAADSNLFRTVQEGGEQFGHVRDVTVDYITKEYHDGTKWTLIDESHAGKGVFAGERNFSRVVLGKNLRGVGNYAFYGTGIEGMTFTNSLKTIGEGAFQGCSRLAAVDLVTEGDKETSLTNICAYAFQDCTALTKFNVPWSVDTIGDSAFQGCNMLETVELCNTGSLLQHVGFDVFAGCARLKSLTFPDTCKEPLYLSTFRDCASLQYICARSPEMTFMDDDLTSYKQFKASVGSEFYFEGQTGSKLQEMCRDSKTSCHSGGCKDTYFAFSYIDGSYAKQGLYELTMKDPLSADGRNIFVVTEQNELNEYIPLGDVKSLTIPAKIGPYSISTIRGRVGAAEGAFANLCNLEAVVIPNTVKAVGDYAFAGCHNLTSVIFDGFDLDGSDNITIGPNAFQTQEWTKYGSHPAGCGGVEEDSDGTPLKKLAFIGPISEGFGPFNYAMSQGGAYNNGSQAPSYITYYTGWPYNLKVEYDAKNDISKLVEFPALSELEDYVTDSTHPLNYYYTVMDANKAYAEAMETAANSYASSGIESLTPNERTAIDAALNVVVPDGIDSIKDGLFYEKGNDNKKEMTVTAYSSLKEIKGGEYKADGTLDPETATFAGCEYLTGINLWPGSARTGTVIDDYAFQECTGLEQVSMDDNSELGVCPFYKCNKLKDVNFGNEPARYICKDSIIYAADSNGEFSVILECLGGKTGYIEPVDLAGVTGLREGAFKGSNVEQIDLTKTSLTTIPPEAFADTLKLRRLLFPSTLTTIGANAFKGSAVNYIFASNASNSLVPTFIDITAFDGLVDSEGKERTDYSEVTWVCEEGSTGEIIGVNKKFTIKYAAGEALWTVIFWDWSSELGDNVEVLSTSVETGDYVLDLPEPRGREGMVFTGWKIRGTGEEFTNRYPVIEDLNVTASYGIAPPDYGKVTVTFLDDDGTLLRKVAVEPGTNMEEHEEYKNLIPIPSKKGYLFTGWDRPLTNIEKDLEVKAQYRLLQEGECIVRYIVDGKVVFQQAIFAGSQAYYTPPVIEGKRFLQWVPELGIVTEDTDYTAIYVDDDGSNTGSSNNPNDPNGGNSGSGNNPNNPNAPNGGNSNNPNNPSGGNTGSSNNVARHTLQVRGGSGSGLYAAGEQIIITADEPARGQQFSSWTVSPASTVVTDKTLSSFILTMPDNDVAVIANYKARSGSSSTTGSGNSSNTNSNRPNGSTGTVGGTSVVIDKNGLSNTGVVSATVNGSSDNFTIKITDDTSATEAVLRALQAEYGSLDNIKYFPMDISLYDSTGTTKITDTTGLSVDITLPLPDSLITYAGNNKVAGVVNDRLDKLTPRFTTINGVACMTFRAEHFSPYVIYVDIANLSDGTISDNTPTTGDGIHPKWFLSIGLACLSFVMFMIKDNKSGVRRKQKVAVRARH